jgi:phosphatidylglycerophosphate synthase/uncharacterized membrane protein YbhN (UPF0104 family)
MTHLSGRVLLSRLALLAGAVLFALTLLYTDFSSIGAVSARLGIALPLALLPAAAWHLLRTAAWQCCFPTALPLSFVRLFRVRLAAEAISFVTIRGIGGEPIKVSLLQELPAPMSAAAVALERVAYLVVTAVIIGLAAAVALFTLPLSPAWRHVFRGLAIVSACVILGLVALLLRREPEAAVTHTPPIAPHAGRVRRALALFVRELDRQWRDLAYGDRRRLLVLLSLESGAYVMMALEVWVALWAMDVPISAAGAMAIETLTRVASMLSAFIPGNIGALEASNVAAATALQASGGAAALAIVRRLRGLIWCAAGFALAPHDGMRGSRASSRAASDPGTVVDHAKRTLVVVDPAGPSPAIALTDRWGGLPIGERMIRAAAHGYARLVIWSPQRSPQWMALAGAHGGSLQTTIVDDFAESRRPNWRQAQWRRHADALDPDAFDTWRVPTTRDALATAERDLRQSIIKPTDGTVARFNRRLSTPLSVWLIRSLRLSPNAMSVFVLILGLWAGWLFSRGDYVSGVLAAAISLGASILDGCDGELARLQYRQSSFGCWLDTLADYVYYVATFVGLTVGMVRYTNRPEFWWVGGALLAGAVLTFVLLILLRHRATSGRPERLHAATKAHFNAGKPWARLVAKLAPCATRATMPYGIFVLALVDLLPVVLILGAIGAQIYWISLAVELRRLLPSAADQPIEHGAAARRETVADLEALGEPELFQLSDATLEPRHVSAGLRRQHT